MRSPALAVIYADGDGVANSGLRRCLVNALSMGYFKVWPGSLRLVELRGLEPLSPCLQSMAKMSSTVYDLARSGLSGLPESNNVQVCWCRLWVSSRSTDGHVGRGRPARIALSTRAGRCEHDQGAGHWQPG
jgi:hypothetical protein